MGTREICVLHRFTEYNKNAMFDERALRMHLKWTSIQSLGHANAGTATKIMGNDPGQGVNGWQPALTRASTIPADPGRHYGSPLQGYCVRIPMTLMRIARTPAGVQSKTLLILLIISTVSLVFIPLSFVIILTTSHSLQLHVIRLFIDLSCLL